MSAPVIPLSSLRQILAERYPQAMRPAARALPTRLAAIDEPAGGLPCGALTEIVCAAPSCGGQLLLGELLRAVREGHGRAALVDAHDSFDPRSWPDERLAHLVWARCGDTATALRAADIFARDANFALVIIDLVRAPLAELRRTPAPFWYRLQRAAETADLPLAVLTPRAAVPSAKLRLQLERAHGLGALEQTRTSLALGLEPVVQRQRLVASA